METLRHLQAVYLQRTKRTFRNGTYCTSLQPAEVPKRALRYLAKIINIPYSFVASGGQQEVEAMTATIMYRHLNRIQQMEAWKLIRGLDSRPLTGKLVDKVLDTKTNPQWGMWSMTNEE